jgi:hypothetical protein
MVRKSACFGVLGALTLCGAGLAVGSGAAAAGGPPAISSAAGPIATATTGRAAFVDAHDATLEGIVTPSGPASPGATVRVYFQLGTTRSYELQSRDQRFAASGGPFPVHASLSGLQSNRLFHYRLVVVDSHGRLSTGADQTFSTLPETRVAPRAVEVTASPRFRFTLPDIVTVSGRVVPPRSLSSAQACNGFVDIVFRVRTIAIQTLRAGVQTDCTFRLRVRFSNRRRLLGGHVAVHVLFAGNRFMYRLAAPTREIQIG